VGRIPCASERHLPEGCRVGAALRLDVEGPSEVMQKIITPDFVTFLRFQFMLDWKGIHGVSHWARVRRNGLLIAKDNGADRSVIEYFSFLHDSRRFDEDADPDNGKRAAEFALSMRDSYVDLSDTAFSLLVTACEGHTGGCYHEDATVQACWDADRLDLGRVGIRTDPDRMCTGMDRHLALAG
jgi:uncharacterized protein